MNAIVYKPICFGLNSIFLTFCFSLFVQTAFGMDSKPSLNQRYSLNKISDFLIPLDQWQPFPTVDERDFWNSLPESTRKASVERGERALEEEWPLLTATLFLEYALNGNRINFQRPYFARRSRLSSLVLAECMEGQGRFIDEIINGIWLLCEESSWVLPAHLDLLQKAGIGLPDTEEPTVDLMAAETASLIAWTYYLLKPQLDEVSPLIGKRLVREVEKRILNPCLERNDFWWMDFDFKRKMSNWTPFCNSNWLTAVLLLERDEGRRIEAVKKKHT